MEGKVEISGIWKEIMIVKYTLNENVFTCLVMAVHDFNNK